MCCSHCIHSNIENTTKRKSEKKTPTRNKCILVLHTQSRLNHHQDSLSNSETHRFGGIGKETSVADNRFKNFEKPRVGINSFTSVTQGKRITDGIPHGSGPGDLLFNTSLQNLTRE